LDLFAAMVRDRLGTADWSTKREIICLLVKRIEVANDVVRVVFRVDPSSSAPSEPRQRLPHCPTRRDPFPLNTTGPARRRALLGDRRWGFVGRSGSEVGKNAAPPSGGSGVGSSALKA
jgi:site-specific DNA recombinase